MNGHWVSIGRNQFYLLMGVVVLCLMILFLSSLYFCLRYWELERFCSQAWAAAQMLMSWHK